MRIPTASQSFVRLLRFFAAIQIQFSERARAAFGFFRPALCSETPFNHEPPARLQQRTERRRVVGFA
jgi:hypothetical protein